jgi:ribosomal protein L30
MAKLRITYVKSAIGYSKDQKATIQSLGLRRLNSVAIHDDTPSIRGMAFKVRHLVRLEEVGDEATAVSKKTVKMAAPATTKLSRRTTKLADQEQPGASRATFAPAAATDAKAEPAKADDLEVVEGIGPKIAGVLKQAGITTLAELAATSVERLKEILQGGEVRIGDPTTWPEQAALAAEGKWDEFQKLTGQLKAGRRV